MNSARAAWLGLESGRLEPLESNEGRTPGCLVFAAQSLPATDEFRLSLQRRLKQSDCGPCSLIWIPNGAMNPEAQLRILSVDAEGGVTRTADLPAGELRIHIPAGSRIESSAEGILLGGQISIVAGRGQVRLGNSGIRVSMGNAESAGCLEFDAEFDEPVVDAWVRYFYGTEPKGLRYRVFESTLAKPLRLHAAVDLSRPYGPAYTYFVVQGNETFSTNFATPLGKRIYL